jgi:hypothetical protein
MPLLDALDREILGNHCRGTKGKSRGRMGNVQLDLGKDKLDDGQPPTTNFRFPIIFLADRISISRIAEKC